MVEFPRKTVIVGQVTDIPEKAVTEKQVMRTSERAVTDTYAREIHKEADMEGHTMGILWEAVREKQAIVNPEKVQEESNSQDKKIKEIKHKPSESRARNPRTFKMKEKRPGKYPPSTFKEQRPRKTRLPKMKDQRRKENQNCVR